MLIRRAGFHELGAKRTKLLSILADSHCAHFAYPPQYCCLSWSSRLHAVHFMPITARNALSAGLRRLPTSLYGILPGNRVFSSLNETGIRLRR